MSDLGDVILGWLDPKPGERILDLGCGDGAFTEKVAARGASVLGIDRSDDMVEAARRRGIDARVMDGEGLHFDERFDAVVSNAALHWMLHPDAVLKGVAKALRGGGRFVAELGGFGCVAAIRVALHARLAARGKDGAALCPWYFPTAADHSARLKNAGLVVERIELVPRPTPIDAGIHAWFENFAESYTRVLASSDRAGFLDEVVTLLEPVLRQPDGTWIADYTRLRFVARKPS